MITLVPLREVGHLRLDLTDPLRWLAGLDWVPVSASELHLAARSFPLAVRDTAEGPRLGLLVGPSLIVHALRAANGSWRGGYQPIGLRCYPLTVTQLSGDALADLAIESGSPCLSDSAGIPISDAAGRPSAGIAEVYRIAGAMIGSVPYFAPALDHLAIAGMLTALAAETTERYRIFDPATFERLDGDALAAMARASYLSVDLAVAGNFSLQALRPELRPRRGRTANPGAPAVSQRVLDAPLDDLALALDDGELVAF